MIFFDISFKYQGARTDTGICFLNAVGIIVANAVSQRRQILFLRVNVQQTAHLTWRSISIAIFIRRSCKNIVERERNNHLFL